MKEEEEAQPYPVDDLGPIIGEAVKEFQNYGKQPISMVVSSALAKMALDIYLALRPNLKTREDYRNNFITNSVLADTIIEGLIKAGWKPED